MNQKFDWGELFQPLTNALSDAAEQIKLAAQCKMRRFYIVRDLGVLKDNIIAQGVIFEDGTVTLRYTAMPRSTMIYDSIDALIAIHCRDKVRRPITIKYIDPEPVQ